MSKIKDYQKEAEKYKITGLKILTPYDVYSLLVSAWEGGSYYWCIITNESETAVRNATPKLQGEPFVERLLTAIQNGLEVQFFDKEENAIIENKLTKKSWAKAEKIMRKKYRKHLGDILSENEDAITADVFFQCAVLGDCIYG